VSTLELKIIGACGFDERYHFSSKGAWDVLSVLGSTNELHKYPNCILCGIYKCAKKKKSSVKAMYNLYLINKDTFSITKEIGTSCNDYLLNCISNGTVEIGNKEVKKLEKEFVKEG
jgi:hypothetical protein